MIYLERKLVETLLTDERCISACEEALLAKAAGEALEIERFAFDTGNLHMMFMPAMIRNHELQYVGLRAYNIEGPMVSQARGMRLMYILWDGMNGEPLAMMDALWLRDRRTAAVGAIGTKLLARADAERIGVIGSGRQARGGLAAQTKVRPFKYCAVFSPDIAHAQAFARDLSRSLALEVEAVATPEAAVADADVVLAASSVNNPEQAPALKGSWLQPGMHVTSIGGRAELDDDVVTRADVVVINSKSQFPKESFDITQQVARGLISWEQVTQLEDLAAGRSSGRGSASEITLVKTVGTPLQDLLPAVAVYRLAREEALGIDMGNAFPSAGGWYV